MWWDGGLPAHAVVLKGRPTSTRGSMFWGRRQMLPGLGERPELFPTSYDEAYKRPEPTIPRSVGHHREWIDAIKGGAPGGTEFGYAARLTELALLGVVAIRTGKKLEWDYEAMKVVNCPEADAIIQGEPYREGWQID